MSIEEIRAELNIRMIEFEQALDRGLAQPDIMKIYRDIKLLQYNLTSAEAREYRPKFQVSTIIE